MRLLLSSIAYFPHCSLSTISFSFSLYSLHFLPYHHYGQYRPSHHGSSSHTFANMFPNFWLADSISLSVPQTSGFLRKMGVKTSRPADNTGTTTIRAKTRNITSKITSTCRFPTTGAVILIFRYLKPRSGKQFPPRVRTSLSVASIHRIQWNVHASQ